MGQASCCSRNISDLAISPLRKSIPQKQSAGNFDLSEMHPSPPITENHAQPLTKQFEHDSPCLEIVAESHTLKNLNTNNSVSRSFRIVPVHSNHHLLKLDCLVPDVKGPRKNARLPSIVINGDNSSETRRIPIEKNDMGKENTIKQSIETPNRKQARKPISQFSIESMAKLSKALLGNNLLSRFRSHAHQTNSLRVIPVRESFSPVKVEEPGQHLHRLHACTYMRSQSPTKTYLAMASPEFKKRKGKKINSQFSEIVPVFPERNREFTSQLLVDKQKTKGSQVPGLTGEHSGTKNSLRIRTITQLDRIDEMQGISGSNSQSRAPFSRVHNYPITQPKTFSSFRVKPITLDSQLKRVDQGADSKDSERDLSSLSGLEEGEIFKPKIAATDLGCFSPMSPINEDLADRFNLRNCSVLERGGSEFGSSQEDTRKESPSLRGFIPYDSKDMDIQRLESFGCDKLAKQSTKAGLSSNPIILMPPFNSNLTINLQKIEHLASTCLLANSRPPSKKEEETHHE